MFLLCSGSVVFFCWFPSKWSTAIGTHGTGTAAGTPIEYISAIANKNVMSAESEMCVSMEIAGGTVCLPTDIRAVNGNGMHTEVNSAADVVLIGTTVVSRRRFHTRKDARVSTSGGKEMTAPKAHQRTRF